MHGRCPQEQAGLKDERIRTVIGMQIMPALPYDLAEFPPRITLEQDQPPRRELAVIRHAHGDFEDSLQLFLCGSRLAHGFDGSGFARLEQAEG